MAWKFEKTFNIGHVLILVGGLSTGWGMYYSTQMKIEAAAAESKIADAVQNAEIKRLSDNQLEITRTLDKIRDRYSGVQN